MRLWCLDVQYFFSKPDPASPQTFVRLVKCCSSAFPHTTSKQGGFNEWQLMIDDWGMINDDWQLMNDELWMRMLMMTMSIKMAIRNLPWQGRGGLELLDLDSSCKPPLPWKQHIYIFLSKDNGCTKNYLHQPTPCWSQWGNFQCSGFWSTQNPEGCLCLPFYVDAWWLKNIFHLYKAQNYKEMVLEERSVKIVCFTGMFISVTMESRGNHLTQGRFLLDLGENDSRRLIDWF